jgi:hypothetical protein
LRADRKVNDGSKIPRAEIVLREVVLEHDAFEFK